MEAHTVKKKATLMWPEGYIPPDWLTDWRDNSEYSRISGYEWYLSDDATEKTFIKTEKPEYAWEFLRRNPNYQADFLKITRLCDKEGVSDHYRKSLGFNIFQFKDVHPPSIIFHAELYRTLRKWGMGYYLINPAFGIHETGSYSAVRRLGNDMYKAVHVIQSVDNEEKQEYIPIDGGVITTDTETFWLFDVSLPLDPQLKQAKSALARAQVGMFKKKIPASKTDPLKYCLYLRLLDADACGTSDKEIMSVLFPGKDHFTYENKDGKPYKKESSHRNPGRDMLKNHRNAAYYLRDRGFRFIF
jgi:Proteobacterial transcriptional regulator-like domain